MAWSELVLMPLLPSRWINGVVKRSDIIEAGLYLKMRLRIFLQT